MSNSGDATITITARDLTKAAFDAARDGLRSVGVEAKSASSGLDVMRGALGALGVSMSVGAVTAWIGGVIDSASRVDDLSKHLKVSTDAVQRWDYAISLSGGTIDDVSKAVDFVSKSLGEGNTSYAAALQRVGLEFETIRGMKQEDAFNAIAEAVGKIKDPMAQARDSLELLGKGGKAMSAALAEGFVETGKQASVMSADTIARLDAAGDAWTSLGNKATIVSGELIAAVFKTFSQPPGEDAYLQKWADALHLNTDQAKSDLSSLGQWLDVIRGKMDDLPKVNAPKFDMGATFKPKSFSVDDIEAEIKSLDKYKETVKKATAEADAHAKAIKALADAYSGATVIKAAADAMAAVNANLKAGHTIAQMTREQQDALNKTVGAGLDAYKALGQTAPAEMQRVFQATFHLTSDTIPLLNKWKESFAAVTADGMLPLINVSERAWPRVIGMMQTQFLPMSVSVEQATRDMARASEEHARQIEDVGRAMVDLGHTSGGTFGSILGDIGSVIGAYAQMKRQIDEAGGSMSKLQNLQAGIGVATNLVGIATSGQSTGKQIGGVASQAVSVGMMASMAGATTAASVAFAAYTAGAGLAVIAAVKIYKAMNDGRKAMQDFYKTMAGGADGLRERMLILGDAGEKMWIQLTQKTGKGDKKGALAIEAEIMKALGEAEGIQAAISAAGFKSSDELKATADQAMKVWQTMKDSGKYSASQVAAAWEAAQDAIKAGLGDTAKEQAAAIDAISAKYDDSLKALASEYASLSESVGKEAEEAEMGVVETQERARMAQIEAEKKRIEEQKQAEIDASNESYDAAVEAAKDANDKIREIFGKPIRVPVIFDYPGDPSGGSAGQAPSSSPAAKATAAGRSGGSVMVHQVINLDGRVLAESTMKHTPAVAASYGIRR